MKMFSDCSGPCLTCAASSGGCLAGHGDDDYTPMSKEQATSRLESGRWSPGGRALDPSEITQLRAFLGLQPDLAEGRLDGEWPQCCRSAQTHIRWLKDAWRINPHLPALSHCPWCGKSLLTEGLEK